MKLLSSPLRSLRSAALLVAVLSAAVSSNSLGNAFAFDDVDIVQENTEIHSLDSLPGALAKPYWPGEYGRHVGIWRPVAIAVLGLEWVLAGPAPLLFHVVNVLLHSVAAALVVLVLAELMSLPAALVAGLVFAVHPVHVEAVANVVGIAEVLSASLYLAACLIHLRGPSRTSWPRAVAMGLAYAVAFGTKESAITLPGVIFLLDAVRQRLGWSEVAGYVRDRWRLYAVLGGIAGLMLTLRFGVLGSIADPFAPMGTDLLNEIPRIWTLADVWSHYVRLLVFPLDLSADYSPNLIPVSLGWNAANLVGLMLTLGTLAGTLVAWRSPYMAQGRDTARAVSFGVVWFIITISPVSNVLFLSGVLLAERTLYLPSVGFVAAVGWLVVRMARDRRTVAVVGLATVLTFMGWRSWIRNLTWKDNSAVFGAMVNNYPYLGRSQLVVGNLFFDTDRPSEGLASYARAINILGPTYPLITEIAGRLIAAKYYDTAERLLLDAWKERPNFSRAPAQLAIIYSVRGLGEETEKFARLALAANPDDPEPAHLLAGTLAQQGRWSEAAEARRQAMAMPNGGSESWRLWLSLAYLQAYSGDTVSAGISLDSARVKAEGDAALQMVDSVTLALHRGTLTAPGPVAPPPEDNP